MALTELPATRTKMTVTDVTKYLAKAYKSVTGKTPSKAILGLLVGQWGIETGNGDSMWNYNFGNSMPEPWDKYFQMLNTTEVDSEGVSHKVKEKFAAYKTPLEGAISHIRVLKSRDHWWDGLHSGNVDDFVAGLKTKPVYFTGDAATYKSGSNKTIKDNAKVIAKYAFSLPVAILESVFGIGLGVIAIKAYKRHNATRTN